MTEHAHYWTEIVGPGKPRAERFDRCPCGATQRTPLKAGKPTGPPTIEEPEERNTPLSEAEHWLVKDTDFADETVAIVDSNGAPVGRVVRNDALTVALMPAGMNLLRELKDFLTEVTDDDCHANGKDCVEIMQRLDDYLTRVGLREAPDYGRMGINVKPAEESEDEEPQEPGQGEPLG